MRDDLRGSAPWSDPDLCKTRHRIRAYEQRRIAAAIAEAEQRGSSGPPRPTAISAWSATTLGFRVRMRRRYRSSTCGGRLSYRVDADPAERAAGEHRGGRRGDAHGALRHRLPEIDRDAAPRWSLIVPISDALQEGDSAVAAAPRSSRSLQRALDAFCRWLPHWLTLRRPRNWGHGPASGGGRAWARDFPGARSRPTRWAGPRACYGRRRGHQLHPGAGGTCGRSEGFRYRWDDKGVGAACRRYYRGRLRLEGLPAGASHLSSQGGPLRCWANRCVATWAPPPSGQCTPKTLSGGSLGVAWSWSFLWQRSLGVTLRRRLRVLPTDRNCDDSSGEHLRMPRSARGVGA